MGVAVVVLMVLGTTVLGLVLFFPFRVSLRGGYDEGFYGQMRVSWPGRLCAVRYDTGGRRVGIRLAGLSFEREAPRGERHAPKKEPRRRSVRKPKKRTRARDPLPHLPFLLRTALRLLRALRLRVRAHIVAGLGNPADTGAAYGLLQATLRPLMPAVVIEPDFARPGLRGYGTLAARLPVGRLLAIALGAALSREGRDMLGIHRAVRRRPCSTSGN